ncbi:MAG: cupin domain-containing protein [Chloroflexi bacterium]|nr:cupin domain-containing protein [Chloroflexota bacterium]
MALGESESWKRGQKTASFYDQRLREAEAFKRRLPERKKVIHPEDMPWEESRHGRIKHVANANMDDVRVESLDVYLQELPPGGRSGKHRHVAEEAFFVLEGEGYDLHWDVDADIREDGYHWKVASEPKRFDWKAGDAVYIPVNTIHQHVNASAQRPARIISATNRVYQALGFGEIEQLEDAE